MRNLKKFALLALLPLAAIVAVVWRASAAPIGECPAEDPLGETILLADDSDPTVYYVCSNGVPILVRCPDGLAFDPELKVCQLPCRWGTVEIGVNGQMIVVCRIGGAGGSCLCGDVKYI